MIRISTWQLHPSGFWLPHKACSCRLQLLAKFDYLVRFGDVSGPSTFSFVLESPHCGIRRAGLESVLLQVDLGLVIDCLFCCLVWSVDAVWDVALRIEVRIGSLVSDLCLVVRYYLWD